MARWVSQTYGLPMLTEVARAVLAEKEISLGRLRYDMNAVDEYQKEIYKRQIDIEHSRTEESFVSDRAFDNLAYAAEHSLILSKLMEDLQFNKYIEWVSKGVIFFLRPQKVLMGNDEAREFVTWEGIIRIDAMIKFVLEQYEVPYIPIDTASMQERVRTVQFIMKRGSHG